MNEFSKMGIDHRLLDVLPDFSIKLPTEIQLEAIPLILEKNNVIGIAPTGSGKTLAYLIPTIHWLLTAKITHSDPSILILVPTRELVRQLDDVLHQLSNLSDVKVAKIFSGQNLNKLDRQLQEVVDIVVATPGLLLKYIKNEKVNLKNIEILVIDEVDRLLDETFEDDVKEIIANTGIIGKVQTLFFGATLPRKIQIVANKLIETPKMIDINRSEIPEGIKHEVYETFTEKRLDTLVKILSRKDISKVIIFSSSQENARSLSRQLSQLGLGLEELHSGLTQNQRNNAVSNFNSDNVDVLVSSDIAARGLDIEGITHVISYNVPRSNHEYIHRAGRTGRAGKKGVSIIISDDTELGRVSHIENLIGTKLKRTQTLSERQKQISKDKRLAERKPKVSEKDVKQTTGSQYKGRRTTGKRNVGKDKKRDYSRTINKKRSTTKTRRTDKRKTKYAKNDNTRKSRKKN